MGIKNIKYTQTHGGWRGTEVTLSVRWIDHIIWRKPLQIYNEHHIMLLKRHVMWLSLNLPTRRQKRKPLCTAVKSDLTASSSQRMQRRDCSDGNLIWSQIQELLNTFWSFQRLLARLDTMNGLGVILFRSQSGRWTICAARLKPPGKTAFLTTEALSSQKTSNAKLVVNFLHFPVVTHMLKSDKQGQSYDCWNTVHKWKNLGYRFWFRLTMISQNSDDWIRCRIRRNVQFQSDIEF
jgi:hypothetical protein